MKRMLFVAAMAAAPIFPAFAQDLADSPVARVEALEAGVAETQYRLRVAQIYGRPPADIAGAGPSYERAQDSGSLVVRVDRAENQLRQMNGQIEQMQHQQRRLEEQLKKFQQDVEFRFQENAGKGRAPASAPRERRGELEPEIVPTATASAAPTGSGLSSAPGIAVNSPAPAPAPASAVGRRGDAFDPDANPGAPGAPRQIGTTTASIPLPSAPQRATPPVDLGTAPGQPLDLSRPAVGMGGGTPPSVLPSASQPSATTPGGAQIASAQQSGPRLDYDIAMNHYRAGQYEAAEKAFGDFIGRNPKDRLASDAVFFLGESYFQRGRHREAAEQYLKISQHYGRAAKAPEAMLRLGQSLNALGAKEQACASFGELPRKFPNASANLRAAADRESKRAACT